ncbi:hypothetical protein GCM10010343_02970 [Streptomyces avidinii]|nr:hypothetical protein GCM10010343_02970 [Streptomyces avidinii]
MCGEGGGVGAVRPGAGAEQPDPGAEACGGLIGGAFGSTVGGALDGTLCGVQIRRNAHAASLPHSDGRAATNPHNPPDLRCKPR